MNNVLRARTWAAVLALCLSQAAMALETFTIAEIRAEGLQRLDIGTILSYLPLSKGDTLSEQTARQSIRALYESGLFQDVQLLRDGDVLVIQVTERPAITSFEIEGNEKVGGEELMETLRQIGLADGEPFKRALLDQVQQELQRQYYANGYYDVGIETEVKELPNNRVQLKIDVTEGKVTRIRDINIIGNRAFSTETLLGQLELENTVWWMPFQSSDRYSKQQLQGDLEALTSYYQDRGYLKFSVASVQVALSPDKEDIFITVNMEEGEVFRIRDRRFSGDTIVNEKVLERLVTIEAGEVFSRKEATESANRVEAALSDIGFAFAEVTPLPEVDEENREVGINFFVQPGRRAYVRRIVYTGHSSTNDETLRREMRQLESAPFSKGSIERSRIRLARLPFIESVEVDTKPVPGSDDLVDIEFTITERPPGSIQFGVGFSGASGFLVTGNVTHTNVFGSGNRLSVELENNQISKRFSFSWQDPYFTEDGISQTTSVFYRSTDALSAAFNSGFSLDVIGFNLTYGIPLSEYATLRAGLGVEDTSLSTFANSATNILQFAVENGTRYATYELRTGISHDTRNAVFFASRGALQQLNLDITGPGSDLQFYRANYRMQSYVPLPLSTLLEYNLRIGLLGGYGNRGDAPPYENFLAGGARTIRGYRESSLGPRDTFTRLPIGGRFQTVNQIELIVPMPLESDGQSTRTSLFYDLGNVFASPSDFSATELRTSAGVSFTWYTPFLGILDMSYAIPIDDEPGDRKDRFQINFGSPF